MANLTQALDRIAMTAITAALLAGLPVSAFMFVAPSF